MIFKEFVLFIILFITTSSLVALNPDKKINHYVINNFTTDNGFPQSTVYSIYQTYDGYLFLATAAGLVRYNGKKFKVYKKKNSKNLPGDWIYSIAEDHNHILWLSVVSKGIARYKDGRFLPTETPSDLASGYIYRIFVDKDNNIWFLNSKTGIIKYDGKKYSKVKDEKGEIVIGNSIKEIFGDIYIGSVAGIYKFRNNKLSLISGTENFNIRGIDKFNDDSILFSCRNSGLKLIKNNSISDFLLDKNIVYDKIFRDSDNGIWITTFSKGVFRYYNGRIEKLYYKNTALADSIYVIFEDNDGNIYFGSHDYGFSQLKDGKIFTIGKNDGLSAVSVHTLTFDQNNTMYMSHRAGISVYKNKKIINYNRNKFPVIPTSIKTLKFQGNYLYAGFRHKDYLVKFDSDFKNVSYPLKFLNIDRATSSYIMGEDIYFINKSEIKIMGKNKKIKYEYKFKSRRSLAINILKDSNNRLWLAFMGGKIAYLNLNTDTLTDIKYKNKDLPYSFMFYEDKNGVIWIPSYGNGIYAFKDNRILNLNSENGFPEDNLYAIAEDNKSNLWFSTNFGLLKVPKKVLLNKMIDKKSKLTIRRYGKQDGMLSEECNGGFSNSVAKDFKGNIYFATTKGVAVVDTNKKDLSVSDVPIKIESVVIDGHKKYFNAKQLMVLPDDKRISFSFALLTYSFSDKIKYYYKLSGYDNDWIETDKMEVSYTNLDAGRYKFEVKAKIKEEDRFSRIAGIGIIKKPYYYETYWFRIFILFLIILLISMIFLFRIYYMKKRQKELERLISEKTKKIKEMTLIDSLTGLRNRRFFYEVINSELNSFIEQKLFEVNKNMTKSRYPGKYYGFLMLDIDFFKKVNDKLGHLAGDKILKQFANILKESVRKDDYVLRWGGEEFLIILKNIKSNKIFDVACKIKNRVENYDFMWDTSENTIKKTCSIGSIQYPVSPDNPDRFSFEETLSFADLALYYSKDNGRNMVVHISCGENFSSRSNIIKLSKNFNKIVDDNIFKLNIYR